MDQLIWINPLLLALLPALIIIALQPISFNKYQVRKTRDYRLNDYFTFSAYLDLEGDHQKELIRIGNNTSNNFSFILYDEHNDLQGQWNLNRPRADDNRSVHPILYDFNNDSCKEITVFTLENDSLFLNVFDYRAMEFVRTDVFVDTIGGYNSHRDFTVNAISSPDNKALFKGKIYFAVAAGFALYPRQMYSYRFDENKIVRGGTTGMSYMDGQIIQAKTPWIIATSNASGNVKPTNPIPYHDSCAWVMGLNQDLSLKFKPIPMGKYPCGIHDVFQLKDQLLILCHSRNTQDHRNVIFTMDHNGNILNSHALDYQVNHLHKIVLGGKTWYIATKVHQNKYIAFNPQNLHELHPAFLKKLNGKLFVKQEDLHFNGKRETLVYDPTLHALVIFLGKLKHSLVLPLSNDDVSIQHITYNYYNGKINVILLSEKSLHEYIIESNPGYGWRIPFYMGVYILSVLFMSLILILQNNRTERLRMFEQQIANLQLQNVRNQLDPHFTFNALNSVGNAIYHENKEQAYDLFQRFTRMIRSSLIVSEKVFRALNDELTFTNDYLEFQKTRFKNRFDFSITVEEEINSQDIQIPKMLIQGFAENAVKHAFHEINYVGNIHIKVGNLNGRTHIDIIDNGIGIEKSKRDKNTSGTKKGEHILLSQIQHINQLYKTNINISIVDKSQLGANGTRVRLML